MHSQLTEEVCKHAVKRNIFHQRFLSNRTQVSMVYNLINQAGCKTREEFVNHEPQASDLRILHTHCFYIIIQKARENFNGLPDNKPKLIEQSERAY